MGVRIAAQTWCRCCLYVRALGFSKGTIFSFSMFELDPLFLEYFCPPHSALQFESHIAESSTISHNPSIPHEEELASARELFPEPPGKRPSPVMSSSSSQNRHSSFISYNKHERNRKPALQRLVSDRAVLLANIADEDRRQLEVGRQCTTRVPIRRLNQQSADMMREELVHEVRRLAALVSCPLGLLDEWEGGGADDGEKVEDGKDEDSAMDDLSVEHLTDGSSGLEEDLDRMDLDVVGSVETNNVGASSEASPPIQQISASTTPPKRKRDIEDIVEVVNAHRHKRMLPEAQRRRSSFAFTIPI